jgi:hypothetical protein
MLFSYVRNWKHIVVSVVIGVLAFHQIVFTLILVSPPEGRVEVEFCHHLPNGNKAIMIGDVVYNQDNAMKRIEEVGYMSMIGEMHAAMKEYVAFSDALVKTNPRMFTMVFKRGNGINNDLVSSTPTVLGSEIRSWDASIDPHGLIFEIRLNIKRIKLP